MTERPVCHSALALDRTKIGPVCHPVQYFGWYGTDSPAQRPRMVLSDCLRGNERDLPRARRVGRVMDACMLGTKQEQGAPVGGNVAWSANQSLSDLATIEADVRITCRRCRFEEDWSRDDLARHLDALGGSEVSSAIT